MSLNTYINQLIVKLKSENEEEWMDAARQLISLREKTVPQLMEEINKDEYISERKSIEYSRQWNALGLGFLQQNMLLEAIQLFLSLVKKEPENPATLNNFGVALVKIGDIEAARQQFEKAHQLDLVGGYARAITLPAWKNLQFIRQIQSRQAREARISTAQTAEGSQALLSRSFLIRAIIGDLMIGGLLGGFTVSLVMALTKEFETSIPGITWIISAVGLGITTMLTIIIYSRKS